MLSETFTIRISGQRAHWSRAGGAAFRCYRSAFLIAGDHDLVSTSSPLTTLLLGGKQQHPVEQRRSMQVLKPERFQWPLARVPSSVTSGKLLSADMESIFEKWILKAKLNSFLEIANSFHCTESPNREVRDYEVRDSKLLDNQSSI